MRASALERAGRVKTIKVALVALVALMTAILARAEATAQQDLSIGVDADASGNTATTLNTIDSCVSVKNGDTFQVDVFVTDVSDLLAWEIYFRYDPSVVTIVDRDAQMFLAGNPGSEVFDASEPLPDGGGLYRLAAVDLAIPHAPDSGSGVLTRLTLQAVASGISPADIASVDIDGNGTIDVGPLLTDERSNPIGPSGPEGFFAGSAVNATIAVDSSCPAVTPVPTTPPPAESPTPEASPEPALTSSPSPTTAEPVSPTTTPVVTRTTTPTTTATSTATPTGSNGNSDDGTPWPIVGLAAGLAGAMALVAGGTVVLRARRGRAS